jgi:hypothetical protein
MTHAIDRVFIDAILVPLLREPGLPEALPLAKLSPRMQKWVLGEAACLQRDAMSHPNVILRVLRLPAATPVPGSAVERRYD